MGGLKLFRAWFATIVVPLLVYVYGIQDISVEGKSCQCLANWVDFGNYCYRFIDEFLPFQTAQDKCNSFSRGTRTAQVATVLSEEENEFLGKYVAGLVGRTIGQWISLKYDEAVGEFVWTDGSMIEYTNWKAGFPNSTTMACVKRRSTNYWVNWPCEYTKRFVCKILKRPLFIS